jgi:hypothetical protein
VCESDEFLTAVSFYTTEDFVNYHATIYDDFDGTSLSGELGDVAGIADYSGFHTADLPQAIELSEGNDFYVYLFLSNGGQAYDRTSDVPVLLGASGRTIVNSAAAEGESYYRESGVWLDFYDFEDPSGYMHSGNFCVKALTNFDNPVGMEEKRTENYGSGAYPNPFSRQTTIYCSLEEGISTRVVITDNLGRVVISEEVTGTGNSYEYNWDGTNASGKNMPGGIYIYMIISGNKTYSGKVLLVR